MNLSTKEQYIRSVLKHVHFIFDHNSIRKELLNHMEDLQDEINRINIDHNQNEELVIQEMGDPELIGRELNKVHKPWLGWLWIVSRYALVGMIIYFGIYMYTINLRVIEHTQEISDKALDMTYLFNMYDDSIDSSGIIKYDIHERFKCGESTIILEHVIFHPSGRMAILYQEIEPYNLLKPYLLSHNLSNFTQIILQDNTVLTPPLDLNNSYFGFRTLFFEVDSSLPQSFTFNYNESIHSITFQFEVPS